MGRLSYEGLGLTFSQAETFKLSVSAACRRMTAEQILDLADFLHDIIRKRAVRTLARPGENRRRRASDAARVAEQPL